MTELERLQQLHARLTSELDAAEAGLKDLRQRKHRAKKELDAEMHRIEAERNFDKLIDHGWERKTLVLLRFAFKRAGEVKKLREGNRSKEQAYNRLRWFLSNGKLLDHEVEWDAGRQQYAYLDRAKTVLEYDSYSDARAQLVDDLMKSRHKYWEGMWK